MKTQEIKEFCKYNKVRFESLIDGILTTTHKFPIKADGEINPNQIKYTGFKTVGYRLITNKWKVNPGEYPYIISTSREIIATLKKRP
jgi:hypothetical protein